MLAEVVRRDAALRLPLLRESLERAQSADEIVDVLVASLQRTVRDDPEYVTVGLELFALARRHPEVATEVEALLGGMRSAVGDVLAEKERAGIVALAAPPEVLADLLFAVGDGAAMRMLAEPERDPAPCSPPAATPCARCSAPAADLSAAARRPRECPRASPGTPAPSRARPAASRSTSAPTA